MLLYNDVTIAQASKPLARKGRGTHSMNFIDFDLKYRKKGTIVEVRLDAQAHVRLMDYLNFGNYRTGLPYKFYGGFATRSPSEVQVPNDGHWVLVVDLGTKSGSVAGKIKATVSVKNA